MNDFWQTPQYLFDYLNEIFNFEFDGAANDNNRKCEKFSNDSLNQDWNYKSIWLNPPYSRGNLPRFMEKAYKESLKGCSVVCLVPLDITGWVRNWVINKSEIWIPDERVCFMNPDTRELGSSPSKGSMIVIYGPKATVGKVRFFKLSKIAKGA